MSNNELKYPKKRIDNFKAGKTVRSTQSIGLNRYRVMCKDNGPGIVDKQIPKTMAERRTFTKNREFSHPFLRCNCQRGEKSDPSYGPQTGI